MRKFNDQSKSLVALDQDSTLIAVIEMSQSCWLVGGLVSGLAREPERKLAPDAEALLRVLHRWRDEAIKAGREIRRICVAYEAGRDGFWLARWLRVRGIECHVIHPTSIPVSREHRRAKSDRLDIGLLKRAFLGWLRGEAKHCTMAAIPTLAEEDAKRANRERQALSKEVSRIVNRMKAALARLGIRNVNVKLRNAAARLEAARTGEGEAVPPSTLAELKRDMARLGLIKAQIREIEAARLKGAGIQPSMSRVGCPWDNAMAESFMRTLKKEEVNGQAYRDRLDAQGSIGRFIEEVYNRQRLHSALDYLAPMAFEAGSLLEPGMPHAAPPAPEAAGATMCV